MKKTFVLLGITVLLLSFSDVRAQGADDSDEAESTIRLMGSAEAELPDAVTKEILLPPSAIENSAAVEKAAHGLGKTAEKNEQREHGLEKADDAREHGAEMAEQAQQNRESRGRSQDRPEQPDPPGPPGK